MALETYRRKRRFNVTPEPRGAPAAGVGNSFVIQKHAARRLHYDLRLELDGVMLSWAVTRGPSLIPGEKRLAVHVEDHPIEYNAFEGTIPQGEYGAGTVMIWDRGHWFPQGDPRAGYKKGHLDFRLEGEKLSGGWHLVRMRRREGERQDPWLLIKAKDAAARSSRDPDILEEQPLSAATGRSMEEIAAGVRGRRVWRSNRTPVASASAVRPAARQREAKPRTAAKKTRSASKKGASSGADGPPIRGAHPAALPDFIPPCLALLGASAPAGADWVHEIKFDGYRMQARLERGEVRLFTRRGLDWTDKFPAVAETLTALPAQQAIIDGEIVVETAEGRSSFSALQEALKAGGGDFVFYAFDLLHLDGHDAARATLEERKAALKDLLQDLPANGNIRFSEHFATEGPLLLKHACALQLEGIVSKRRQAPYRSGRSGDWVKTKCSDRQEFVVIGYAPASNDARAIGALILGYYRDGEMRYAGRVGTGYTQESARELWRRLAPLRAAAAPVKPVPAEERRRSTVWVEPRMVVEIDFRGWTHGDRLRHPSFKGVREDKLAAEIVREEAGMGVAARTSSAAEATRRRKPARGKPAHNAPSESAVRLTNPDRVYWEDVALTKRGLADYYTQVWDWIAPHVTGRALSLVRCPEGAGKECFFQKHASAGLDARRLTLVPEDGDHVISIEDLDGLLALVQAGVLEIHVRGSTTERLDAANRIVFDLDPAPEVGWGQLVAATREVRARLESAGLTTFLKTTGGKGLHVVAPIAHAPWDEVKAFTRSIAVSMAGDSPARYVATASKRERTGRIFIDYLRNSREATAICAYSTRARPGAPVSVPIAWSELGSLKASNQYTVGNLMQRMRRLKRDPWADIAAVRQRLPARAK